MSATVGEPQAKGDLWLEMRGVVKDFPGQRAVDNVDLEVRRGEIHALVGENGAGKSTLIKVLAGVYDKTHGSILIDGNEVHIDSPRVAQKLGLTFIYQEAELVPDLNCIENLTLGMDYPRNKLGLVDWPRVSRVAREMARQMDVNFDLNQPANRLSLAQQTMLMLSRAFFQKAYLIVLDEPTASLTESESRKLFSMIYALRELGVSFIYVTHKLEEVFELADTVTVMRNGRKVDTVPKDTLDSRTLFSMIVGRDQGDVAEKIPWRGGKTLFSVRGLSGAGFIKDVSFDLAEGEVLGITGLVGAGKSELARLLFGVEHRTAGTIRLDGKELRALDPRRAIRAGIVMVPEDRRGEGLISPWSVRKNITIASLEEYCLTRRTGFLNPLKEMRRVRGLIDMFSIRTKGPEEDVGELSGGNQQKVTIAKWLSGSQRPKVFILDEATHGVDIGARNEIYKMIKDLADTGAGVILLSSDIGEIVRTCSRTLVMREGRIIRDLKDGQVTKTNILAACYGG